MQKSGSERQTTPQKLPEVRAYGAWQQSGVLLTNSGISRAFPATFGPASGDSPVGVPVKNDGMSAAL